MKTTLTIVRAFGNVFLKIWRKAPFLVMLFLYVVIAFTEKQINNAYKAAPELYFYNNHIPLSSHHRADTQNGLFRQHN